MKWKDQPHPIWGKVGIEERVHTHVRPNMFPKRQWTNGKLSIISPSTVSNDMYELYDGEDIYRFDTLEEAKRYGEGLLAPTRTNERE